MVIYVVGELVQLSLVHYVLIGDLRHMYESHLWMLYL